MGYSFYFEVMWQCEGAECTYQHKLIWALLVSGAGNITILHLKHLLSMERGEGEKIRKCKIAGIEGSKVIWEMTERGKTGVRKQYWECMVSSISIIIGWSWSGFFVSLIAPITQSVGNWGGDLTFEAAESCGILCFVYWALVIPLYHSSRNSMRLVQMEQMENFVRHLDQAREHDKCPGKTDQLLPELLDRMKELVNAKPQPVLTPELVGSVKDVLLPEFSTKSLEVKTRSYIGFPPEYAAEASKGRPLAVCVCTRSPVHSRRIKRDLIEV